MTRDQVMLLCVGQALVYRCLGIRDLGLALLLVLVMFLVPVDEMA